MDTSDPKSNATKLPEGILLFIVTDAFDIEGLGCVLFPGIPYPSDTTPSVCRGAAIILRRPDGSAIRTFVRGLESIRTSQPKPFIPISLPRELNKFAAPSGTEVWLCGAAEHESNPS